MVGHPPAFRDRNQRITGTRPSTLDKDGFGRQLFGLRILGKVATALRGAVCPGKHRHGQNKKYAEARKFRMHSQTANFSKCKNPGQPPPCLAREKCWPRLPEYARTVDLLPT